MGKFMKTVYCLVATVSLTLTSALSVSAHNLENWANYYTDVNANGSDNFSIMNSYHVDGRNANYYWENSIAKNNFSEALLQGENAWGGMIDITENSSEYSFVIRYNPNIASDAAAYVTTYIPSYGHYGIDEVSTEMVIGDIINYTAANKKRVLTHELGHLWGINDLYQCYPNLESIYSQTYNYAAPTRHDKNAMYIGQNRPWYTDANGNLKFLKSPGRFAVNEWVYAMAYQPTTEQRGCYYVGGNGVMISGAYSRHNRSYQAYSIGSRLTTGQTLLENQYLSSENRKFIAKMQSDGNFVVYNTDAPLWATGTNGQGVGSKSIKMESNGNIVMRDSTGATMWHLWGQSGTNNRIAVKLIMQDDGNLVAYDSNNSPIWYTGVKNAGIKNFYVANIEDKNSRLNRTSGATSIGNTLKVGQVVSENQYLMSSNKKFIAKLQGDGNFVVYNTDGATWASNTDGLGQGTKTIKFQSNGDIILCDSTGAKLWSILDYAGTDCYKASKLIMQDDGNLVAYADNGKPVWWSQTNGAYGYSTFS